MWVAFQPEDALWPRGGRKKSLERWMAIVQEIIGIVQEIQMSGETRTGMHTIRRYLDGGRASCWFGLVDVERVRWSKEDRWYRRLYWMQCWKRTSSRGRTHLPPLPKIRSFGQSLGKAPHQTFPKSLRSMFGWALLPAIDCYIRTALEIGS